MYGTGANEGNNDGHDVDCQLKLEKFCNRVVDVTAPHHGFHDGFEVVISQDNVARLFSYIRSGNALKD